eukprot:Protomagalhaensia_sp_Gyna_25__3783@NODE_33_length_6954_cov_98_369776_g23_i0_p3_GENE_NODE_33_length_6954_cov_98_369776_g23_i0NODE_33_length_6954_cov_98_369776_g23_i0_p3_ORF_typecomplete_len413_score85_942oxoacid_dh/PF00198_23/2_5e85Biotin_lipoyl/PF00364_22/3_1e17HlyD_D23/PF16576_5/0_96HlyD_D23/PF16576_5/0_043Biotin_lipoyl_2/PF13533_6/0_061Biotin_lipoyl_2/PF13533_6/0_027Biotin_lipoyl_2/PF13533_6/7e03HlyD_3/PF13437_6/28HlyD_3/PF13437_6/0_028HlyD_2/PF12700_7/6_6HlyD_2/PF12700_7/0_13HlyD_2/PF12700_7/
MLGHCLRRTVPSVSATALRLSSGAILRFASVKINVPEMGESITEGTIQTVNKKLGDRVQVDEVIAVIETDKISVDVTSPIDGTLTGATAHEGDTVYVGDSVFEVDSEGGTGSNSPPPNTEVMNFRLEGEEEKAVQSLIQPEQPSDTPGTASGSKSSDESTKGEEAKSDKKKPCQSRSEERIPLTRMRLRIAERLKGAQSEGVLLTTFQECDMSAVTKIRKELGKQCVDEFGIKLGFNSFFIMACAKALKKWPDINSVIDGNSQVKRNFVDISMAVATPTGLVVPVIRDADKKGLLALEKNLSELAKKARDNKLGLDDMSGGTFTISNGGIYGSMMGTPIINPPQSAILGMHSIQERPVVRDGQVVVRPIMYLALTYDHRIVDGREAVSFLKDVADMVENPVRLLLEAPESKK